FPNRPTRQEATSLLLPDLVSLSHGTWRARQRADASSLVGLLLLPQCLPVEDETVRSRVLKRPDAAAPATEDPQATRPTMRPHADEPRVMKPRRSKIRPRFLHL
ncbi:unnamed protein product, partial [Urochloa humidicola]